ncbi:hypothetical protein [Gluconacetobacter azotocaptans]|uniref:hypothetical protein n=1 Tax=Gluconacetobacter azotocaptans TaxID=142834 RepID=UPI001C8026D3|nr:hypothetical protein [Gluconacetobacter azotocaptans]
MQAAFEIVAHGTQQFRNHHVGMRAIGAEADPVPDSSVQWSDNKGTGRNRHERVMDEHSGIMGLKENKAH